MPIVTRLLDAFFRTLDAVDAARERIDRVLGRTPEPIVTSWDATPGAEPTASETWQQKRPATWDDKAAPVRSPKSPATQPPAPARAKGKSAKSARTLTPQSAQGAQKKSGKKKASRKGSVDRTGADVDSPRARAVLEKLKSERANIVAEDALLEGKKVLARVVWALAAAEDAGSEQGLTAADASALLHLAAGMEVFSTNIARACRDETHLIEEGALDGRSKRYKLTTQGRTAAGTLAMRPLE